MLSARPIEIAKDRDFLLALHCLGRFEEIPAWARRSSYIQYRDQWLQTEHPDAFIKELQNSLADPRTLGEVWEEDGKPVGYLWVVISEPEGYGQPLAEIRDIVVASEHQRRGIGGLMLQHAEEEAHVRGAFSLRSETSFDNAASQAMHGRQGFKVVSFQYEKVLSGET
jgi:GNAT superfamily N-acetyltransferase